MNIQEVPITTPLIQLDQFLKWAGIAETGGHAKEMIKAGMVSVNGITACELRKKLYPEDVVAVEGGGIWKVISN